MMIKFSKIILCLCVLALFQATVAHAWTAKVVKVVDGDTVTVLNRDNIQIKIRLYGIDCPERGQPFGKKAKQFVLAHAAQKQVEIEGTKADRYGRIIGIITLPDRSILNEMLLEAGYAWVYRKYCKSEFCGDWLELEEKARSELTGLWSDKSAMPPWDWRRK